MAKKNKSKKRRQAALKQEQQMRRTQSVRKAKVHQVQKDAVSNFLSNIAASSCSAGLLGIAVTKGDHIGFALGGGLIAIGLALMLCSLILKR